MIGRCTNPQCGKTLKRLGTGAVYALERRSADTEFFWLCEDCLKHFQLVLDLDSKVDIQPLLQNTTTPRPHPDGTLCRVFSNRLEGSHAGGRATFNILGLRKQSTAKEAA